MNDYFSQVYFYGQFYARREESDNTDGDGILAVNWIS